MTGLPPVLGQIGKLNRLDLERVRNFDLERDEIRRHEWNVGMHEQLECRQRETARGVDGSAPTTVPPSSGESRSFAVQLGVNQSCETVDEHYPRCSGCSACSGCSGCSKFDGQLPRAR